ncbi:MAG: hypothetical protein KG003_04535 [Bacteroidetes bacterium]|nr:hypothetical protein [Bacteroidota bacterium]
MSDLISAISETINNQNSISDFINASKPAANQINEPPPEKRGRGRPKGSFKNNKKSAEKSFIPEGEIKQLIPEAAGNPDLLADINKKAIQRKNAAAGATVLIQTTGMMVSGEDGKMDKDEFSSMQENFDRYFEIKNISDFPPGISLGLSLGAYYVRVLTTEKTRPKISLFFAWVKNKYYSLKKQKNKPSPLSETAKVGA